MNSFDPYHEWLGIPPERQPPDHYALLGLRKFEADPSAIETAAETRMSHVRSFQTGPRGHLVGELLNQVATARRVLLDPKSRRVYDDQRLTAPARRHVTPPPPPAPTPPAPPPPPRVHAALGIRAERRPVGGRQRSWPWVVSVVVLLGASALAWGVASGWASGRGEALPTDPVEVVTPEVVEPVVVRQEGDGSVHLTAAVAELHGESLKRLQDDQQHHVAGWRSPDDDVSWQFHLTVPGIFRVDLTYLLAVEDAGAQVELVLDGEVKETLTLRSADEGRYLTDLGFLAVHRSGAHTLRLRLVGSSARSTFRLRDLRLVPKFSGTASRDRQVPAEP